jgi:hypothetical protein
MSTPLSDAQLAAIALPDLRAEVMSALSTAGAFCGECGFEPGEAGCPDCVRVRGMYADAVMPIIERLRAELARRDAAFEAVMAMDDDVNALFNLGQVARTYTRVLITPEV